MAGKLIETYPVHLGLGASAVSQPEFTGALDWYTAYAARHASDGIEGRLVSMHSFTQSWEMWEMHPHGSEVVLCTAGTITIHQEYADGTQATHVIETGQYVINPPGVWHTADVAEPAAALFITPGAATQHRPR